MPVAGRKPKDGPTRNRMPAAHEWVQVENKPFRGRAPVALPKTRRVMTLEGPQDVTLLKLTHEWWKVIKAMPHCKLWGPGDWLFALETALVADAAFSGSSMSAWTELRRREEKLGTTADALRGLRIRYVEPVAATGSRRRSEPAKVVELDPRRTRLVDAT